MLNRIRASFFVALVWLLAACASKPPANAYIGSQVDPTAYGSPATCCTADGPNWGVAAGALYSGKAAEEILAAGGNLVDAAVAVAFCLAVERPHSDGLAGGGFMTLHLAGDKGGDFFVDFRETAPHRATRDMYLDAKGKVVPGRSQRGALAVGVPGFVAGMSEIHHKWGKLTWKQVLQPSIRLAEEGFPIYPFLATSIAHNVDAFRKSPDMKRIFLKQNGQPLKEGEKLVQKDLGGTLRSIADKGPEVFYHGELAKKILATLARHKGILDHQDLEQYQVKFREPVKFTWQGYQFVTAPPPSAGGAMFAQMLGVLDKYDLHEVAQDQTRYAHLLSEVMKRAYADRSLYIGDPDFTKEPWTKMFAPETVEKIRASLDLEKNTPSQKILPNKFVKEDHGTTHLSLLDKQGNSISTTLTINDTFGALLMVPGTGMFLNNEMDDFSVKPGTKNIYGLTGGEANSVAPGKRPVSSMTPTIVLRDGQPILSVGGAGGSRIISAVFQIILNDLAVKPRDVRNAVFASRIHQQWLPDQLDLEPGFKPEAWQQLKAKGHNVVKPEWDAHAQAVGINESGQVEAVTEPRDAGGVVAK